MYSTSDSTFGERQSGLTPKLAEEPSTPPNVRTPRSSKYSAATTTPRQLRPLNTAGSSNWQSPFTPRSAASNSEDLIESIEDVRRRYHFNRTTLMQVDASGVTCKSVECAKNESAAFQQLLQTGLKNFDILLPGGATRSECRSAKRDYLRLYYSDYIGQRPAPLAPFQADAVSWEVDALREFLDSCRPRTRVDAYPLLLITQDILRKLAEKEIKLVNSKTDELSDHLAIAMSELSELRSQRSSLEASLEVQRGEIQSIRRESQSELKKGKISSIMQRGLLSNVKDKSSDKMNKMKGEMAELQSQIRYLATQIEQKDILLKKADSDFESHLKQEANKKKLDIFLSWKSEERKAVIVFALSDPSSVGGIEKCLECMSRNLEPLELLWAVMKREFGITGNKSALYKEIKEHSNQYLSCHEVDAETQTNPSEDAASSPGSPIVTPQTANEVISHSDSALELSSEHNVRANQLIESMAVIGRELDQRVDTALNLNEDYNTEELSSELKVIKGLVRQLSTKFALMDALLPKEGTLEPQPSSADSEEILVDTVVTIIDEKEKGKEASAITEKQEQPIPEQQVLALTEESKKIPINYTNIRLHEVLRHKTLLSKESKGLQLDQCQRVIHECYQSKIVQDMKDDASTGRKRQSFDAFFKDFLVRKYGLRSIATKQLCSIAMCIDKEAHKNARIRAFGELAGFIQGEQWTQMLSDFALGILHRVCEFEGRDLSSVSEWLDSSSEPGITVQAAVHALKDLSLSSPIPFKEVDVNGICALPKNSSGNVVIEHLLLWCMDFFRTLQKVRKEELMSFFEANDKNGDGVLDFQEFESLIKLVVQSDTSLILDRRDISQMYQEALRDDLSGNGADCMSKEAFSELAMRRGFKCTFT